MSSSVNYDMVLFEYINVAAQITEEMCVFASNVVLRTPRLH